MAMTLQEMLDLLPDNDTGSITASDMRTIVTELFNANEATNTAVESVSDQAEQTASALVQTNQNFDALFTQVQEHESRISDLEA